MNGGIPPLRDRRFAAAFIVVVHAMVGVFVTGLVVSLLTTSTVVQGAGVLVGGALGAAFAAWRIRRTPEEEREDDGGY
ncbi:hypothetical protein GCM10010329_67800 [Streptomyces spiroverticillatus]|uniref:Uncharacterized protein n=1 Tax=Streptomyces finlayi TaxID=67296 RepID=A0A919CE25_9ACTN|nr:hypothetical protein [Streptomyces finlayi]GHA35094.1 hypothetical protein GCM10010329_67800 [Streptomyces spiroverticillatus]GHD13079.1 hypothetical protein GCM10010334_70870 [Streptomyces finlayi]